ncbi:major facilitator superfamily domain-containing protein [Schizophyllum commune]
MAATTDSASIEKQVSENESLPPVREKQPLSKRILRVVWDSLDKSPQERKLLVKIDWWILSYVCVAYFIKYLDQTNISQAYVSGMKEDLKLAGNDLNLLTTWWTVGYILGQLPSQVMLSYVRPSIWLPTMELLWSVFVIGMAGAKNVKTMYALRFFVGLFEASAYPGIMTLLGNWYIPAELGKRSCIFQASSSAAQMFSGYLQAALHSGMDGRAGLASWRWLMIFDGIIAVPICIYGYFAIPDSPTTTKVKWLNEQEKQMTRERMERVGRAAPRKLTWQTCLDIAKAWPVWLFSAAFIAHVLAIRIYSYMNLWLKAAGTYSTEAVNIIPTGGYALQIVCTLLMAWTSDAIQMRWPLIIVAATVSMTGTIILSVWPSTNSGIFAGWYLTFCETGAGALFISWINEVLSHSEEQRRIVIGVVETLAFTFQAWVPLLIYNTGEAPRFRIGYQMAAMFFAIEILLTLVMAWLWRGRNTSGVDLKEEKDIALAPRQEKDQAVL